MKQSEFVWDCVGFASMVLLIGLGLLSNTSTLAGAGILAFVMCSIFGFATSSAS